MWGEIHLPIQSLMGMEKSDKAKVSVNVTPNGKLLGQSENQVTDAQNQLSREKHRDNIGDLRNQWMVDNEATDRFKDHRQKRQSPKLKRIRTGIALDNEYFCNQNCNKFGQD